MGVEEFGLQDRMQIAGRAVGVLLRQALGTMMMTEAEVTGAVDGDDGIALEAEVVERLHPQESLGVLVEQFGESVAANMADKGVVEGPGDWEGRLLGLPSFHGTETASF